MSTSRLDPIPDDVAYQPAVSIYGEWRYLSDNFMFSFSSKLVFNKDGTFKECDRSCTGIGFSEGTFQNFGSTLILKSFEKYKTQDRSLDTTYYFFDNRIYRFVDGFLYEGYIKDFPEYIQIRNYP